MKNNQERYIIREGKKYHFEPSGFLWLPNNVYWKNKHLEGEGCNDPVAEVLGVNKRQDFKGLRACEFTPAPLAKRLDKNDSEIIKTGLCKSFIEYHINSESDIFTWLSYKIPIWKNNQVDGLFGISTRIHHSDLSEAINGLRAFGLCNTPLEIGSLSLDEQFQKNLKKLTPRETETLHYLLCNMTAKEISRKMDISYRTVEIHIENIKKKLLCRNRQEVISKVLATSYTSKT